MRKRKVIVAFIAKQTQAFVLRNVVLLPVVLGVLATPAAAQACGMPLGAHIPAEQALIIFTGGREEIITSVQLLSDKPDAALIFPVPSEPEVGAAPSETLGSSWFGTVRRAGRLAPSWSTTPLIAIP